jgi:hypothetical protein
MKKHGSGTAKNLSGAALALAAASLFLAGGAGDATAAQVIAAKVQCQGVNACKGKSDCATASNACHGQNACKGQGWVSMTEKECLDKGGKATKG